MDGCATFGVILFNNVMDLHVSSFSTLVPEEHCYFVNPGLISHMQTTTYSTYKSQETNSAI